MKIEPNTRLCNQTDLIHSEEPWRASQSPEGGARVNSVEREVLRRNWAGKLKELKAGQWHWDIETRRLVWDEAGELGSILFFFQSYRSSALALDRMDLQ